jgi:hypothetical protein
MATPSSAIDSSAKSIEKRRWNAFVCQDCRAIFRIPADYEGKGVVCPSCDRMLRLPRCGESTPPLVQVPEDDASDPTIIERKMSEKSTLDAKPLVEKTAPHPLEGTTESKSPQFDAEPMPSSGEWRRRKKHRSRGKNAENEWQQSQNRKLRFSRRIPLAWIWVGGILTAVAIVIAAAALLRPQRDSHAKNDSVLATPFLEIDVVKASGNASAVKQLAQIKEAHKWIETFLQVRKMEDLMPMLRPVDGLEEKTQSYYLNHPLQDQAIEEIDHSSSALLQDGRCFQTQVIVKNQPPRLITLMKIEGEYKVDGESWVGWSEMNVSSLRGKKPLHPVEVRVVLEQESYYNFDFPSSMESRWQSYKLTFPDDGQMLHGYVDRSLPIHQALIPPSDVPSRPMILRIRYRDERSHSSQVLIDSVVAEGWVKDMPRGQ